MLAWLSGTIFGREGRARGVQDQRFVVRRRAAARSRRAAGFAAEREGAGRPVRERGELEDRDAALPSRLARQRGRSAARRSALALRSER